MPRTTALGDFIRESRLKAGFPKQEALAEVLRCNAQYVHLLETGKSIPSLPMSVKLEKILRIDRNKLVSQVIQIKIDRKLQEVLRECEAAGIDLNHVTRQSVIRHVGNELRVARHP